METKHTPGPWRVGFRDHSGPDTITTVKEHKTQTSGRLPDTIAVVRWGCDCCKGTSPLNDTELANARLIAAAPELLDICQKIKAYFHNPQAFDTEKLGELLEAAIAKAEGQS